MKKLLLAIVLIVGCESGEANIEHDCSVSGFGRAECVFTNKGDADGSVCIKITMTRNKPLDEYMITKSIGEGEEITSSNAICSGIVKAGDVVDRQKTLSFWAGLSDSFCKPNPISTWGRSWTDNCTMSTKVVPK